MKMVTKSLLALVIASSFAYADLPLGQKLYQKKLMKHCGFNGAVFAAKHTVEEWEDIGVKGMKEEIKKLCPKAPDEALQDKFLKYYHDFAVEFASDSGNVPTGCG